MVIETLLSIGVYTTSAVASVSAIVTAVNWYKYSKSFWAKATGISFLKHCYKKHFQRDSSARKGYAGEYELGKLFENVQGEKKLLFNVLVPDGKEGTSEIDALMIHETGIYVFENKNYGGTIGCFSDDRRKTKLRNVEPYAPRWDIVYNSGVKKSMFNPVLQNEKHIACLKAQLKGQGISSQRFFSYVTFNDNAKVKGAPFDFKLSSEGKMLMSKHLIEVLNSQIPQKGKILSPDKMEEVFSILEPYSRVSSKDRKKHINRVSKVKEDLEFSKIEPRSNSVPIINDHLPLSDAINSAKVISSEKTSPNNQLKRNYINLIQR